MAPRPQHEQRLILADLITANVLMHRSSLWPFTQLQQNRLSLVPQCLPKWPVSLSLCFLSLSLALSVSYCLSPLTHTNILTLRFPLSHYDSLSHSLSLSISLIITETIIHVARHEPCFKTRCQVYLAFTKRAVLSCRRIPIRARRCSTDKEQLWRWQLEPATKTQCSF